MFGIFWLIGLVFVRLFGVLFGGGGELWRGRREIDFWGEKQKEKSYPQPPRDRALERQALLSPFKRSHLVGMILSFASILSGLKFTELYPQLRTIKPIRQQRTPAVAPLGREQPPGRLRTPLLHPWARAGVCQCCSAGARVRGARPRRPTAAAF